MSHHKAQEILTVFLKLPAELVSDGDAVEQNAVSNVRAPQQAYKCDNVVLFRGVRKLHLLAVRGDLACCAVRVVLVPGDLHGTKDAQADRSEVLVHHVAEESSGKFHRV